MLQSLHQHENRCLTVNLHLFVQRLPGGLVNTRKHDSHCFTSGYYVQCSIMLYFVKFVGHRKKNKLLELELLFMCCYYHSLSPAVTFFALGLR